MAETNNCTSPSADFKEAVCIDAGRIFDSCCDRDCLEDLRCYFTDDAQGVVNNALNIRAKNAEVLNVYIDVEPVSFNRGYYSCNLTFYFLVEFEVCTAINDKPKHIFGVCFYEKKVILYGSEGNVRIFSSVVSDEHTCGGRNYQTTNMPRCKVQTVDPIVLSARIAELKPCCESACCIPSCVCESLGGPVNMCPDIGVPTVLVTLGLFSIIQLVRNVQMLVPVYDFCIPEKHCSDSTDSPCDVFSRIKFPTDDFFPPKGESRECGCGCNSDSE